MTKQKRREIQNEITQTALKHGLVSKYTSMVAVDVTASNNQGMLYKERLKNNLPHGWKSPNQSTGIMLAQTASNSRLNLLLAMLLLLSGFIFYRYTCTDSKT